MSKQDDNDALVGFLTCAGLIVGGAWLIGFGTVGGWLAAAAGWGLATAWKGIAWATTLAISTILQTVATTAAIIIGGVLVKRYLGGKISFGSKKTAEEEPEVQHEGVKE
jgi:hypothetical protein